MSEFLKDIAKMIEYIREKSVTIQSKRFKGGIYSNPPSYTLDIFLSKILEFKYNFFICLIIKLKGVLTKISLLTIIYLY